MTHRMIQDIHPHVYHNEYTPHEPREGDKLLVITEQGLLAAQREDGSVILPDCGEKTGQFLFTIDEISYFLWEGEPLPEGDGFTYLNRKEMRELPPDETLFACAAAESLWRWYTQNRFCGKCGKPMEKSTVERAMVCPDCGNIVYPKICPAVIVAIMDGDRLLLTKYANRKFRRYALVAGFNEIGESIEETVHREVFEETGLRVKNLRFYRSQPWVYTDSLLMGFYCDLDGSDEVHRQESELSEAVWFHRKDLPTNHSGISLTGDMIIRFRHGLELR